MLKAAEIEIKKEHQVLMVNKTTSFKKQGKSKGKNKKSGKKAATPHVKPKSGPKPMLSAITARRRDTGSSSAVPENVPVPPTPATEEANDNDHETSNETATEPQIDKGSCHSRLRSSAGLLHHRHHAVVLSDSRGATTSAARWNGEVDVVFINNRTCDRVRRCCPFVAPEPIVIKIFYALCKRQVNVYRSNKSLLLKLSEAQSNTFPTRYRSGGTPAPASDVRAESLRAVARRDQGQPQSWEPPALQCCPSLLAGGFLTATHSGTPGGTQPFIGQGGALMDSAVPKSVGYSDYVVWRKPKGRKTIPTTFFIVDSKSTYAVPLGRDWIHANCCIPSTMHQCLIQWDGDEVEVVHADDSSEISTAGMNVWETSGQEPLSGINLDDCERIDVTKDGVRLVLSTGLTV
ncbi:hypothetical protein QYE76_036266 [Lolium multiflorum]|uniref:Uncharacterized protein n=1 Tax=Lolium multiflorum TaxID=4521 RepID=A0AAD8R0P5_LOLMU|nr:hypothetical protein QYE76_036266 [Lolium multiflorum]